jgi:hypothetical protein
MAAAPAVPTGSLIEALFRPSTRFRDRLGNLPRDWTELELLPGLTIENVRAMGITWEDFCRFLLQGKVVWMTPDVYIHSQRFGGLGESVVSLEGNNDANRLYVHVRSGTPATAATWDFLVRLLATCESHDVHIRGNTGEASTPLSGAGLSLFFQESPSCLRQVTLFNLGLSEDQCLALAAMSRLDVEVTLIHCRLVADDAAGAFVECLHSDGGPIELRYCNIESQIIASGLTGNSRVTKLTPDYPSTNDAETAILVAALATNRGLEELDLEGTPISDDIWRIICNSMKAHPTLTNLNLLGTRPSNPVDADDDDDEEEDHDNRILLSDEQKSHRTRVLAYMMKANTILRTILLTDHEHDEKIYTEDISPYLETNLYRPRVLAVKKTHVREFREKVLGRALDCVKSNPNLVWMFLSQNVDAFVRSEEEAEAEVEEVVEEEDNSGVAVSVAAAVVAVNVAGSKRKR